MNIWRPNEPDEEGVSAPPGMDLQNKRPRSRRHAWRDGFADQTVVKTLEDSRSYRAFERALIGSVYPRSVIELELVYGLTNLLWRLRRARAIETGLLNFQGEFLDQSRQEAASGSGQLGLAQTPPPTNSVKKVHASNGRYYPRTREQKPRPTSTHPRREPFSNSRAMAQCFLRLSHIDPTLLERAGTYESRLWRQAAHMIWVLDAIRRPPAAAARPRFRKPVARYFWDPDREIRHAD
jgi:hypothetical protein